MATAQATPSIKDLAAATPGSRDRYVDFLRALSIAVVVFGNAEPPLRAAQRTIAETLLGLQ